MTPTGPRTGPRSTQPHRKTPPRSDDTEQTFRDAFTPPWADEDAPDAEAYESAIRVIGLDDNESDEGDHHGEISPRDQADDDTAGERTGG